MIGKILNSLRKPTEYYCPLCESKIAINSFNGCPTNDGVHLMSGFAIRYNGFGNTYQYDNNKLYWLHEIDITTTFEFHEIDQFKKFIKLKVFL